MSLTISQAIPPSSLPSIWLFIIRSLPRSPMRRTFSRQGCPPRCTWDVTCLIRGLAMSLIRKPSVQTGLNFHVSICILEVSINVS